jgi:hypothetical protein
MATRRKQDNTKRPNGSRPPLTPGELYHHEKRRRAAKPPERDLLAEAERAYKDLLAAEAEAGRGGRPKKNKAKPKDDDIVADDE